MLNGFFKMIEVIEVIEDQLGVGDFVEVGEKTGVVEAVGIRVTRIRSLDGTLWFIHTGEIVRLGNKSQAWSRVVFDLPAPYDADLDILENLVLETVRRMDAEPEWAPAIIEQPEIWGIQSVNGDAMVIRLVLKNAPLQTMPSLRNFGDGCGEHSMT